MSGGGAAEVREAHRLTGHADRVWALAWNPALASGSGPVLTSCSDDKTVQISKRAPDGAWQCSDVLEDAGHRELGRQHGGVGVQRRRLCSASQVVSFAVDVDLCSGHAGVRERGEERVVEPVWVAARHGRDKDGVDMGDAARERVRVCLGADRTHTGCQDGAVAPDP